MDNNLLSHISLNPQFSKLRKIKLYNVSKQSILPLSACGDPHRKIPSFDRESNMGLLNAFAQDNYDADPSQLLAIDYDFCLLFVSTNDDLPAFSMDDFIRTTYHLIHESPYGVPLDTFVHYCANYGPLFYGIAENKPIPVIEFQRAISSLCHFLKLINWLSLDHIRQVSRAVLTVVEQNPGLKEIYICFADQEMMKLLKLYIDGVYPDSKEEVTNNQYFFPELLSEIGMMIMTRPVNIFYSALQPNIRILDLSMRFTHEDVHTLKHGTTGQKELQFKRKLLELVAPLIIFQPTHVVQGTDKPLIQTPVADPLSIFLLKVLIDSKYNTCLYCGQLTPEGQKYCPGTDHKEKYRRSTPRGKLDQLLRQWIYGNSSKETITEEQRERLCKYGNHLIEQGMNYKTEVLPSVKKMKRHLQAKGE